MHAYKYFWLFGLYTPSANCGNPNSETNSSIKLMEFSDPRPALEGVTVNFTCAPGMILTGPNSTTCTENGLWDPDPRDTQCRSRSPGINIRVNDIIRYN